MGPRSSKGSHGRTGVWAPWGLSNQSVETPHLWSSQLQISNDQVNWWLGSNPGSVIFGQGRIALWQYNNFLSYVLGRRLAEGEGGGVEEKAGGERSLSSGGSRCSSKWISTSKGNEDIKSISLNKREMESGRGEILGLGLFKSSPKWSTKI